MLLAPQSRDIASPPCRNGARVGSHDRILRDALAKFPPNYLWLHWLVLSSATLFHQLLPHRLSLLGSREKAFLVLLEQRHQSTKAVPRVSNQTNIRGVTQADALRVEIDLHAFNRAGLGKKLNIGKRRADHKKRVAFVERILRRLSSQQSDAAGGVETVVGHGSLS